MATQFSTLYTIVTDAIGRADTLGLNIAKRGVNYGQVLAAIALQPPELKIKANVTAAASSSSASLGALTAIRYIDSIYNTTGSCRVSPILKDKFELIVPSGETYVKFYYYFSNTIYYNIPVSNNTLSLEYIKYPTALVNDTDALDFDNFDSLITSTATSYAFAMLEESDAQGIWDKVMQSFAPVLALTETKKNELKEAMKTGGHSL